MLTSLQDTPSDLISPPPRLRRELGMVRDLVGLPRTFFGLRRAPRGAARVIVSPGFMTGDGVTWALRRALRKLGHDVRGWGLGRNRGDVRRLVPLLLEQARAHAGGGRVHLVGWSLGGVISREVAREAPELVAQVITLASPVVGGPKYTAAACHYRDKGIDLDALEREVAERNTTRPLQVPVTALFSRRDAVVCPAACIDRISPDVTHIEVDCTHFGFGFNRRAIGIVAERLARG